MKFCHNFENDCCRKNDMEKRKKTETGRIYCDFFAQHSILDNFSRVNVVKILNPSQKMIKMPTQNTPEIFGIFCLTPQKNCRDQRINADNHNPQKFLLSNPSENSFTGGVDIKWPNGIGYLNHPDVQIQAWNICLTLWSVIV